MNLEQAAKFFDTYDPASGEIHCCGFSVIQNSQNGIEHIYCSTCQTAIRNVPGYGWDVEFRQHPRVIGRGEPVTIDPMDFTRATELSAEVSAAIEDAFEYHSWDSEMIRRGAAVRVALAAAVKAIVAHVPPGPDRTVAIRKLREARMDANSAITHDGKY